MRHVAISGLVGLAIVSLAALAWKVGRPIEVAVEEAPVGVAKPTAHPARHQGSAEHRAAPALQTPPHRDGSALAADPSDDHGARERRGPLLGGRESLAGRAGTLGAARPGGFKRLSHDTTDPVMSLQMDEANQYFQRGQYAEAKEKAQLILSVDAGNARMLRLIISAACMMGDAEDARTYYDKLTSPRDRTQMRARCGGAGVELPTD